jgi:hypothetical protein
MQFWFLVWAAVLGHGKRATLMLVAWGELHAVWQVGRARSWAGFWGLASVLEPFWLEACPWASLGI